MECGECDLCCYLFGIDEINKDENTICKYYDSEGCNCSVYDDRPKACKDFRCAFLQIEGADNRLRPDKLGIVFEKINDRIFFGTIDIRKIHQEELSDDAKGQLISFKNQGFSVVLRRKNKYRIILAEGHKFKDIKQEIKEYSRKKYGKYRKNTL